MTMPESIATIITVIEPYKPKAQGGRPPYVKTLQGGTEIEIKIPIHHAEKDIPAVMDALLSYNLRGAEHRSEIHYVYALENGSHLNRMVIKGNDEIWLKKKSKNTPITTPLYKFPVVCRSGEKLNIHSPGYQAMYEITAKQPLKTQFEKECLNFFYTYHDCVFSLSFSLAWNNTGFLAQEMELEYEGHTTQKTPPSRSDIESMLEAMFIDIVPVFLHGRVHAATKYESLTGNTAR